MFGIYLVAAVPALLYFGSGHWFAAGDDWGLILRDAGSFDGLFRHQHQHWSTVPVISYQLLFALFGLEYFWPYQLVTIVLFLSVAVAVRGLLRQSAVRPWIATVVAATLVLYGSAYQNALLPVQVSMMSTLLCGIGHLMLLNHDGRLDRRDFFGLVVGLVGLMTSGMAPLFVAAVALASLLRRGWRLALFHAVPLVVAYFSWLMLQRSLMTSPPAAPLGELPRWIGDGVSGVFLSLGEYHLVAAALAAVLVVGVAAALREQGLGVVRRELAVPLAMVAVVPMLFVSVAWNRWFFGIEWARQSRYLGIGTVLTLPLLGVAMEALARRWTRVLLPLLALVLVGDPATSRSSRP